MNHHLLQTASRWVTPILIVLALYMALRGHNDPGGGFVGGLLMGVSNIFYQWAYPQKGGLTMKVFGRLSVLHVLVMGLSLSLGSVIFPYFIGRDFMTGVWKGQIWLPLLGNNKLGTPVYFDLGVFLVVTAVVSWIFYALESEPEE
jgi:multicomponent Na+:H+ antiporter subunit B